VLQGVGSQVEVEYQFPSTQSYHYIHRIIATFTPNLENNVDPVHHGRYRYPEREREREREIRF
jgi:hypothetical protein